ncbi:MULTISPECIES: DUF951 domain-containing protein [Peptoniphilus]|uniref:DUF951 domain-containing protein n=1 Tax=Peptoniphilus duerdenii ATCC BAA-1640 TaxID=862517 RepID=E0NP43_9FIRM|nr:MULTISPECIES: DUF951 domain-containing protein [Peptoniphilus]EFM24511.1 hypothetical protein HMPREF9225_1932 [Peptoniphilus duerdenii ATCC BAA-1640]ERT63487.1 PF06107 family protein [Peptoniphilus sp. BV3AC2]
MLYYELGDIVTLKKPHACGENEWEITRLGIDMKLKCLNCERVVWISRIDFEKRVRKIKVDDKFISIVHHEKKEE